MIDSSAVKAHRSASSAQKGGAKSTHWALARRAHDKKSTVLPSKTGSRRMKQSFSAFRSNLMPRFLFLASDCAIAGEQPVVAMICARFIN
jgi:hypothetical protein